MKAKMTVKNCKWMFTSKSNTISFDISVAEKKMSELKEMENKTNPVVFMIDRLDTAIKSAHKKKKWFDDFISSMEFMADEDSIFMSEEDMMRFS